MVRKRTVTKKQLRALKQYKDLTDEEFEDVYQQILLETQPIAEFEERIREKLDEFEQDYDLTDLKFNDRESLRALCQAIITLEDYETILYRLRMGGVSEENLTLHTKLHNFMSDLRRDIINMQDALKISRKIRKGDREESVINELDRLKRLAAKFLSEKMFYVYCPECRMLLSTTWFLYPESSRNKLTLVCQREIDDEGKICGTRVVVSSKDLLANKGRNIEEVPNL